MRNRDQPAHGWTVVLRRQPVRIVEGRVDGGYADAYELICCDCGDHPDLDYREVSLKLQRIRGPYPFAAGVAAYQKHLSQHHRLRARHEPDQHVPSAAAGQPGDRHPVWPANVNTSDLGADTWQTSRAI